MKPVREALNAALDKRQKINAAFLAGIVKPENAGYWNAELAAANTTIAEAEAEIDSRHRSVVLKPIDFLPELLLALADWAKRAERSRDDANSCRSLLLTVITEVKCVDGENFRVKAVAPNVTIAHLERKNAENTESIAGSRAFSVAPNRKVGCP
ncbi:hypothetical protein FACS1894139_14890 [Planctomycetales bacterium]|nr:hypothetical protein FACS1894107_13930 [Planctomycetales bacterium]GHS99648.1 hypothetical protein FACS1894108_10040 [Planctomycetales bacterium]GHT07184.1 hypothetical protein FACS1894139_14890 [Planctomycetales bacterium]